MSLFYIVAAGPSYMDVTEDEWKYLSDKHTLTFARVPYGSRKFEYYMSIERAYADKSVLSYMSKLGYFDTKLLLSIPESIELARELGFKKIKQILKQTFYFMPSRRPWFIDEPFPPHKFKECRANTFKQPLFRFRGQLTATINTALVLGATEIRLIGVDLNNQTNFYDTEYLDKVCKDKDTIDEYRNHYNKVINEEWAFKRSQNKDFNPEIMHTTNMPMKEEERWGDRKLRGVADVIQWMDSELKEEGMEGIYITNKSSLLYRENKLSYRGITDGYQ